jgi:membrane fusion protein (multidrug efflux system)
MDRSVGEPPPKPNNRQRVRRLALLILLVGVLLMVAGGYWLVVLRYRVSTDNAYVTADSARISSRVAGTIVRVLADNDQPVERGEVLLELDPRDYTAAVEQAQGALARIEAQVSAMEISIPLTDTRTATQVQKAEAELREAREKKQEKHHKLEELQRKRVALHAELRKALRDFKRFESLYRSGAVSERQRDGTHTQQVKSAAALEAIDAEMAAVRASLQAVAQEVQQARAQLRAARSDRRRVEMNQRELAALRAQRQEAEARLKTAELQLSYCTIVAPINGYVAQKSCQIGDRVQPGQPLMAVVPLQDVYVEANFKETQLEHVRLGQPATITADAYPDYTYHGRVAGIRAGTGATFSLLPPENATGNWIKVVQRVPVKIALDTPLVPDHPLRVGLSLEVTVHTRDRSGSVLVPHASGPRVAQP